MTVDDLDRIERQLIEARDALITYWEQPEGQACFLALRIPEDALADSRAIDHAASQRDADQWRRIYSLIDEIKRLRAPLEGSI